VPRANTPRMAPPLQTAANRPCAEGRRPAAAGACLLALLPPDGVLYDVGSNWGYYSLLAARQAGFRGRVHAFEPWPPSFADLSSIIRQGELENTVTAHHTALAAESGQAIMSSGRHSGLARLVTGGSGPRVTKGTIDELGLDRPDFIKLDVEGFETEVLRGGKRTLGDARPFIIFESSTKGSPAQTEAVMQLLEDWNYRLFIPALSNATGGPESALSIEALPPGPGPLRLVLHPVTRRTRQLHREYLNILAVPSDRASRIESLVETA